MAFNERIRLTIDVLTGSASSTFSKLKADLRATDGAFNKAKVSAGALGGFLKENMATAALAGGTALIAFGTKAVMAFQDVALGAGRLRDALGVTAEEASRFQEVGKDLGVGVEAIEVAIGRMNRTAASTPGAFDSIGASIVRNQDGTINTTETFIAAAEALSRIPDAARRAEAGQKIFGRGWQSIAEIIMEGGEGIREMMASVEDAKIISDDQVDKARDMRDELDELKGSVESLALMIGEELVPVITDVAEVAGAVVGPLQDVKNVVDDITSIPLVKQIREQIVPWERWGRDVEFVKSAFRGFKPELKAVTDLTDESAVSTQEAWESVREFGDATMFADRAESAAAETKSHLADVTADAVAALDAQTDALEREKSALEDNVDAMQGQVDARRGLADSSFALHDAEDAHTQAVNELTLAMALGEAKGRDLIQMQDEVAESAVRVADAHVDQKTQQAAARGETLSATAALDAMNSSLLTQAANAEGPARTAILNYIGAMNGIPTDVQTLVSALVDQGKVGEAKKILDDTSKSRTSTVLQDANKKEAAETERLLNEVARDRDALVTADPETTHANDVFSNMGPYYVDVIANPVSGGAPPGQFAGGADSFGGGTDSIGSGSGGLSPRVKKMLEMADAQVKRAADLKTLADALREQAKATKDVEDKEKLLDKVEKLAELRARALAKARDLAERAADKHADAIRRESGALDEQADKLREHANRLRELAAAASAALREQASSMSELVDAQLSFEDAQRSAQETFGHAKRAFTTEGVTKAQQAEAINDARQAALAVAEAEVERARERAEAAGREFTEADAARVMQRSLERQAEAIGGPVGKALKETIRQLEFPKMIRLFERADKREDKADKRADKEERIAEATERAAEKLARAADKIDNAKVTFPGLHIKIGNDDLDPHIDDRIRRELERQIRAIRAGRR